MDGVAAIFNRWRRRVFALESDLSMDYSGSNILSASVSAPDLWAEGPHGGAQPPWELRVDVQQMSPRPGRFIAQYARESGVTGARIISGADAGQDAITCSGNCSARYGQRNRYEISATSSAPALLKCQRS